MCKAMNKSIELFSIGKMTPQTHNHIHTHTHTLSFALLPLNCHLVRAFFYLLHVELVRLVCRIVLFVNAFESLFVLWYFNWNRYQCIWLCNFFTAPECSLYNVRAMTNNVNHKFKATIQLRWKTPRNWDVLINFWCAIFMPGCTQNLQAYVWVSASFLSLRI